MDKNKKKESKSGLSSILSLSCFSSRLLLELSLCADAHFQTWGDVYFRLENSGGKLKDKLAISSVVIQMLVFSDLSAMNYFSEFSNSDCMYPVQVLGLYSVWETGWSVLTPCYLEWELQSLFVQLINNERISKMLILEKDHLRIYIYIYIQFN